MVDFDYLATVREIRQKIAAKRAVIRQSVLHRASVGEHLLRMENTERDCYKDLSALYERHREVCKHPSRALNIVVGLGRRMVNCRWCHKNISSEKVV